MPALSKGQLAFNWLLVFVMPLPGIFAAWWLAGAKCDPDTLCSFTQSNAMIGFNVLLFFNFDIGFWIVNHIQGSMWLVDLYWCFVPILGAYYYQTRDTAEYDSARAWLSMSILWLWAARLTHNYLRREEWMLGEQEDWRLANFRKQFGWAWYILSLPMGYISQHLMLFGLQVPFYGVYRSKEPLNVWDIVASTLAISGILFTFIADN